MPQAGAVEIISAVAGALSAGGAIYQATQSGPKAQAQPQAAKDPSTDVYKGRNAQNAIVQGGASTGTGSLLVSNSNVAGNSLLGS